MKATRCLLLGLGLWLGQLGAARAGALEWLNTCLGGGPEYSALHFWTPTVYRLRACCAPRSKEPLHPPRRAVFPLQAVPRVHAEN